MDTYTQPTRRIFTDLGENRAANSLATRYDADVARSEINILRWTAYLPEDCVRTMIQMGWDLTT
jgi:hypothetical protein